MKNTTSLSIPFSARLCPIHLSFTVPLGKDSALFSIAWEFRFAVHSTRFIVCQLSDMLIFWDSRPVINCWGRPERFPLINVSDVSLVGTPEGHVASRFELKDIHFTSLYQSSEIDVACCKLKHANSGHLLFFPRSHQILTANCVFTTCRQKVEARW